MLTNPHGLNDVTGGIIAVAIDVHRECGPGLLESVYQECMRYELRDRRFQIEAGTRIELRYRGHRLAAHYQVDLCVNQQVIVEIKSVDALAPVHRAQVLTYLKITGCPVGLLINFNVPLLKQGVKRVTLKEEDAREDAAAPIDG